MKNLETKRSGRTEGLSIWYCSGCGVVHMAAGGRTVNFDRREFDQFAESVADVQLSVWMNEEAGIGKQLSSTSIH